MKKLTIKYSKGLRMFKAEFNGLSMIEPTKNDAIVSLTKAYNALPTYER